MEADRAEAHLQLTQPFVCKDLHSTGACCVCWTHINTVQVKQYNINSVIRVQGMTRVTACTLSIMYTSQALFTYSTDGAICCYNLSIFFTRPTNRHRADFTFRYVIPLEYNTC